MRRFFVAKKCRTIRIFFVSLRVIKQCGHYDYWKHHTFRLHLAALARTVLHPGHQGRTHRFYGALRNRSIGHHRFRATV